MAHAFLSITGHLCSLGLSLRDKKKNWDFLRYSRYRIIFYVTWLSKTCPCTLIISVRVEDQWLT